MDAIRTTGSPRDLSPRDEATAPHAYLVCRLRDLLPGCGAVAWVAGREVALFRLPGDPPQVRALGHFDPVGQARVLAHGIVGDVDGEPVVASPLYRQHFSLRDGRCLERPDVSVPTFATRIHDDWVYVLPCHPE